MNRIKNKYAIKLVQELIERIPVKSKGTYNRQDPTHYEKGELDFKDYIIEMFDCTWGVEITIHAKDFRFSSPYSDKFQKSAMGGIYLSQDFGYNQSELIPRDKWDSKYFKLFQQIVKEVAPKGRYVEHQHEREAVSMYWSFKHKLDKMERDRKRGICDMEMFKALNNELFKWSKILRGYREEDAMADFHRCYM
ncbi:MAG TPA: hypothetical protein VGG71_10170 [Chitinophagaceae bacterium]|jgi:hypothetical protein